MTETRDTTRRDAWLLLGDEELLGQCRVDLARGTGPGGQKRNKTSTCVRLTHLPSGLSAMNDETRSQHTNRLFALRRLRLQIALELRCPPPGSPPGIAPGQKADALFLWIAKILDILQAVDFRVSDAASLAGLSTGKLTKELARTPALWQKVNSERTARQLPQLRQ